MESMVVHQQDIGWTDLGGGVSRRVLSHTQAMMVVEVRFDAGSVGSMHTHPHAQSTYVASGAFRFTVEGETAEVRKGDAITFAAGVPHGTLCLQAGTLIDIFSPMREDFL